MLPAYVYAAQPLPQERQARCDGDTFWFDVDLGLRTHVLTKLRLRGVNAPELGRPGGLEAKVRALELIYAARAVAVRTHPDRMTRDRWEADIYLDGRSLADVLVAEGHAVVVRGLEEEGHGSQAH